MRSFPIHDQNFLTAIKYIDLDIDNGPWIAGGAARKIWSHDAWIASDIDFFFSSSQQLDNFKKSLKSKYKILQTHVGTNSITFKVVHKRNWFGKRLCEDDYIFQAIFKYYPNDLNELFSTFDLSVCQFACDGKEIFASELAVTDCSNNMNTVLKTTTAARILKYASYGFTVPIEVVCDALRAIQNGERIALVKDGYENF